MIGGTQFVHRLDHRAGMLGIDVRSDPVTQIEHVTLPVPVALQDRRDLRADRLRAGIEYPGIQISLQRLAIARRLLAPRALLFFLAPMVRDL